MRLSLAKRALPFVGYLVSTFNDQQTGIIQYLSKGNDAYKYQALNAGKPVITSSVLTHGTRDPFLLVGPDRSTFWMLATDLDIAKTSWRESQSHGSRSIVIWSSSDLVTWQQESPLGLEGPDAGYVWAPSAVYYKGEYILFWSSRIYDKGDTAHNKPPLYTTIRYSKTKDFKSFTPAKDYIAPIPNDAKIDQEFMRTTDGEYVRFIKDDQSHSISVEKSKGGIFDRFGGANGYGYDAYETNDLAFGQFQHSLKSISPSGMRHGTVTPLTSDEYLRIASKWGVE